MLLSNLRGVARKILTKATFILWSPSKITIRSLLMYSLYEFMYYKTFKYLSMMMTYAYYLK